MGPIVFRYRSRELDAQDIAFIRAAITQHYAKGRSHISRVLCKSWAWASAAWKVKARDQLIGWGEPTKRKNLHLIAKKCRWFNTGMENPGIHLGAFLR